MTSNELSAWVGGGSGERGAWLARRLGIKRQSVWAVCHGKAPVPKRWVPLLPKLMTDLEMAERLLAGDTIKT